MTVQTQLGLDDDQLAEAVATLREYRLDLRTGQTHPIIGSDRLICTYPFPLLSPRALVESRVKLIHPANEKISPDAGEARVYG